MTLALIAFVLGLLFGSFLNVCISRLPLHESVVSPRSRCPKCETPIAWYDNVPVFSYLRLRRRCRTCDVRISLRYPLVEIAVALTWSACAFFYGPTLAAVHLAVLSWLLIGLFVTDVETYSLPNALTFPGIAAGLAFAAAIARPGLQLATVLHAVVTAAIFCAVFLAIRWLYWLLRHSEGMGLGDIKLIALLSVFLFIRQTALALFIAVMTASLFSLALVLLKKADVRKTQIPFGAFLALGGLVSAFAGARIIAWYLSHFA